MTIYAFDKGQSLYTLAKAIGGQHYNAVFEIEDLMAMGEAKIVLSPSSPPSSCPVDTACRF